MPSFMNQLIYRARRCPVACALKILFLVLLVGALNIAVFFKETISAYGYAGLITVIGYVAVLAIATNGNCMLKISEDD